MSQKTRRVNCVIFSTARGARKKGVVPPSKNPPESEPDPRTVVFLSENFLMCKKSSAAKCKKKSKKKFHPNLTKLGYSLGIYLRTNYAKKI